MEVNDTLIRTLARLMDETGLTEIELADGDKRVRVNRAAPMTAAMAAAPAAWPVPPAPPVTVDGAAEPAKPAVNAADALTSPMVGTVYLQAEPNTPAFVKVGDAVKAGQTVLIIEAMKVMNPIKAHKSGIVTQLLVADAQPVEYGEALMIIE
jgi:acetyl-CoA carboxylase biotin carboxyl carrier protein